MRRGRSTKIIATLGPSSHSFDMVEQLFLKGVDVFRLNFSHGTPATHEESIALIREVSEKHKYPLGIMQDLQGPKLRIGNFKDEKVHLVPQADFIFEQEDILGDAERVSLPHPEIFHVLRPGMSLLLDDGRLQVRVKEILKNRAITTVIRGGELSHHKGVNVPHIKLPISAITAKDREDILWGQKLQVDFVALSFVQTASDIHELRGLLGFPSKILAKLEKPAALEHLEEIIQASDGIMVARGDLGVEVSPEEVPRLQRQIIRACRAAACPVIVATQMLDSMVQRPVPTRAEASDVASAVYDVVDGVMLSAESASGLYPLEAVEIMDRIIKTVETDPFYKGSLEKSRPSDHTHPANAIAGAARHVAHTIQASTIVTLTEKGDTTLRVAYERPTVPIVALTPNPITAQQLSIVWGVEAYVVERFFKQEEVLKAAVTILREGAYAKTGDHIVVTAGSPALHVEKSSMFQSGTTRVLRVLTVGIDI